MLENKLLKYDSIFFDMDGTLWDGVEAYAQGFNDFFMSSNINRRFSRHELYEFMGLEEEKYLEMTLPDFNPEERKQIYKKVINFQYQRIDSDGGILYDGVKEGIEELSKKYNLFIVSNCPEFTIDHFIKWAKIEQFFTDTLSHGANYKSKHENIQLLIEKHQLKTPIYIGDTDSDRKQCDILGIPFGYVSYGFGKAKNYSILFDSFNELTNYFI